MRRWLVLVMIVLLPLRGWAGDFMSVQMVAGAEHERVAMSPDCPMQASAALSHMGEADASDTPIGDMTGCSSCELCIPMAEWSGVRFDVLGFACHEKPAAHGTSFISALPALMLKPPIS